SLFLRDRMVDLDQVLPRIVGPGSVEAVSGGIEAVADVVVVGGGNRRKVFREEDSVQSEATLVYSRYVNGADVGCGDCWISVPVRQRPGIRPLRVIPKNASARRRRIHHVVLGHIALLALPLGRREEEGPVSQDRSADGKAEFVAAQDRTRDPGAI